MTIRTRFAPSPTGYLHIGGVRTALFSWAFAKKHKGEFLLRIEDTDLERSTAESVNAIFDGMHWVGLDYDNKDHVVYQTQNFDRYRQVIAQLLEQGHAYHCYCSKEELEAMREKAEKEGTATYDRRWRPEPGKVLPPLPEGREPVVRFKTPLEGHTTWQDLVKGEISIPNEALDDLIIARADGTPTYNFCVVVDDLDMGITHVIRGDDHVNNTPKQINILKAIGTQLPQYGHLPMILNESGAKMSKRRDAVSVVDYDRQGILPAALLNYLARLGWGHGDDEFFTMEQFVEWFDLKDVSASPSRFDREKLLWLNAQHMKAAEPGRLAGLVQRFLEEKGIDIAAGPKLADVVVLLRERVQTLVELADQAEYFYRPLDPTAELVEKHLTPDDEARLEFFAEGVSRLANWDQPTLAQFIKDFVKQQGVKMPQVGMPLRAKICGTTSTPSVDAVLALLGREEVLRRLVA